MKKIIFFLAAACLPIFFSATLPEQIIHKGFKAVDIGMFKSGDDLRNALESRGVQMNFYAKKLLPKIKTNSSKKEVDLAVLSVEQLGFKEGATSGQIRYRGLELGLKLCSAEIGPALRLQYKEQSKNEHLHMAMKPLIDSDKSQLIFIVQRDNAGLWLGCRSGDPSGLWGPNLLFVFQK